MCDLWCALYRAADKVRILMLYILLKGGNVCVWCVRRDMVMVKWVGFLVCVCVRRDVVAVGHS